MTKTSEKQICLCEAKTLYLKMFVRHYLTAKKVPPPGKSTPNFHFFTKVFFQNYDKVLNLNLTLP